MTDFEIVKNNLEKVANSFKRNKRKNDSVSKTVGEAIMRIVEKNKEVFYVKEFKNFRFRRFLGFDCLPYYFAIEFFCQNEKGEDIIWDEIIDPKDVTDEKRVEEAVRKIKEEKEKHYKETEEFLEKWLKSDKLDFGERFKEITK